MHHVNKYMSDVAVFIARSYATAPPSFALGVVVAESPNVMREPNRQCCITGSLPSTSASNIFSIPEFTYRSELLPAYTQHTFCQCGTPEMS